MHRVEPPCCIISFLYIKPQHRVAGEVKTRLLLSMVFFLLYLAKDVKLKVDALNKCLKLIMRKNYTLVWSLIILVPPAFHLHVIFLLSILMKPQLNIAIEVDLPLLYILFSINSHNFIQASH